MAATTILMINDKLHLSVSASSILSSTSTQAGYHQDNVRDTNFANAWKPVDGASDQQIVCDGGSSGWIAAGAFYVAIAYDARGCDQNTILLQQDSLDNPAFSNTVTTKATFTLDKRGPTVDYVAVLSNSNKRYYRLMQANSARGGGTKTVPIYAWAMIDPTNIEDLTNYPADAIGPGNIDMSSKVAFMWTAGGIPYTNRFGSVDQEFDLVFPRASAGLYADLRDALFGLNNNNRAFWMQLEGLRNYATPNFQMVRLRSSKWGGVRPYVDQYETLIPMMTEPTS